MPTPRGHVLFHNTCLRLTYGVGRNEMFEASSLVLGQFPKLQAETSWRHRTKRGFRYFEIGDRRKRQLAQMKIGFG